MTIVGNGTPAPTRSLQVTLLPPNDGSNSVLASTATSATLTIQATPDAGGVFGFSSSIPIPLTEDSILQASVIRQRGSFGQVIVFWSISPDCSNRISPTFGSLHFNQGENRLVCDF